jgi:hypothetical protein
MTYAQHNTRLARKTGPAGLPNTLLAHAYLRAQHRGDCQMANRHERRRAAKEARQVKARVEDLNKFVDAGRTGEGLWTVSWLVYASDLAEVAPLISHDAEPRDHPQLYAVTMFLDQLMNIGLEDRCVVCDADIKKENLPQAFVITAPAAEAEVSMALVLGACFECTSKYGAEDIRSAATRRLERSFGPAEPLPPGGHA